MASEASLAQSPILPRIILIDIATQQNHSSQTTRRVIRWALGVTAILVIAVLYPNKLRFPFEYEVGQTWRYPDLRAPYDIPVLKTTDVYEADLARVKSGTRPVYQYDQDVARRARRAFVDAFQIRLDSARARRDAPGLISQPERHRRYGLAALDRIYERGVVRARDIDMMEGLGTVITTIKGNEQRQRTLGQLFTPGDAQEFLEDSLVYAELRSPEVLRELLAGKIEHNLFYNDSLSTRLRQQALDRVSRYDGLISERDFIIRQGGKVTDRVYQQLVSYEAVYENNLNTEVTFWTIFGGYAVQAGLVIILLMLYLRTFFPRIYSRWKSILLILLWPVLYALLVRTIDLAPNLSAWIVPFCIVPIIMRIFFTERLAFFVHVIVVLLASFLTSLGFQFVFLNIMAGVVVIIMDIDTRDMGRYFRSLLWLFLFYCLGYIGLELLRGGTWKTVNYTTLAWIAGNVFLVLLAYPLIPLLERMFGLISPITLMELSDMNRPLLERLARQAPGTWQHSLNVANMSEQAARAIGANALLVKTAALYHDIGKIEHPLYFIENQNGPNPHEKMGPKDSAKIIIGHVTDGIKLARQAGLPEVLVDFIRTHHGTTRAEYFYLTYIKDHPEREAEEAEFRYPGPRPATKEQTILMIADSVEAACKSLKSPTEEELADFIDKIISSKLTSKQLENSSLNFRELEVCRTVFKGILQSVHHVRIAYPKNEEE